MKTDAQILAEANELARKFFEAQGYEAPEGFRFYQPHAKYPNSQITEIWDLVTIAYAHIADTDLENAIATCVENG